MERTGVLKQGTILLPIAIVETIASSAYLVLYPNRYDEIVRDDGAVEVIHRSFAALEPRFALLFLVPIALVGLATWATVQRRQRALWAASWLLWLWVVLGAFWWWYFYVPAAVVFSFAAWEARRRQHAST